MPHQKYVKELNDVYEVLSDKKTREIYDKYGEEGIKVHQNKQDELYNLGKFVKFNISLKIRIMEDIKI